MSFISSLRVRLLLLAFLIILPILGLTLFQLVERRDDTLARDLIALGLATVLALAVAWVGGDLFIRRYATALVNVTRRLAAGDLSVRTGLRYGMGEPGQLARALDEMAVALELRENERQKAEAALRETQAFLEKAQEVGHVGSWIADPHAEEGNIIWSKETYQIFGVSEERFDGRLSTFLTYVHPEDRDNVTKTIQLALESKAPYNIEHRIIRPRGIIRWVHQQADIIRDDNHQPLKLIGVVRDITERKQAEETLQLYASDLERRVAERTAELHEALKQEKNLNELKLHFSSMVSHEFRNPLAAIRLSSDVLKKFNDKLTDEKRNEHLDKIQSRVKMLVEMLDQLLIISRADTVGLEFNPISLNVGEICQNLIEEIQHGDQIIFSANGGCTDLHGDEKLLQHIVANLLSNALKYSPDGGPIHFDLMCENGQIIMRVKDEGIGIPEDDLKDLFETFHRAQNVVGIPGTGLGLAIARRAAEAHGGTITVESIEGKGSIFTVRLPADQRT